MYAVTAIHFLVGMAKTQTKPELMSPVGGWPQLRAAIQSGADAVYFGLEYFSARAKVGFTLNELDDVIELLHTHDVKGFVTFNTLVFDNELEQAEQALIAIAKSGADAAIVQDIGVAWLASQVAPELEIHGSTQMSATSAEGVKLASNFGCTRVVLGRELSLADIRKITAATEVETEVFVHGALCVSYSGQCFSSEAWGGRSANRGQCAQACRLSYEMEVDGQLHDTGSDRYLLSPGDLYAAEQIGELIELGVSCFKIEGRYKDENYVAATTSAYRQAIDDAWNNLDSKPNSQTRQMLEQVYSRGLDGHFISGVNHQTVVKGRAPRHRGVKVGAVVEVTTESVLIQGLHEIFPGDGLVFDSANWRSPDEKEEGGSVFGIETTIGGLQEIRFGKGQIDFQRIREGDLVWRTSHPKLVQVLKPLANPSHIKGRVPLNFQVSGKLGQPISIQASLYSRVLGRKLVATANSDELLEQAEQREVNNELLQDQLSRLGGTPFTFGKLDSQIEPGLFLPVSQFNQIRRQLVEQLTRLQLARPTSKYNQGFVADWKQGNRRSLNHPLNSKSFDLHLLVRNEEQLEAAIGLAPATINLDYLELYGLRPAVEKIRAANIVPRVASPRILKPAEQNVIKFLLSLNCPIVVRSGGLLVELLALPTGDRPRLLGDFSLNVANAISARTYLDLGLDSISPTYDLNGTQVSELTQFIDPSLIEVIAYSHLPVFHTEHCVFCRFLSDGTDHTNCGHPCEKHRVELVDQNGRRHPVMADVGCRNTVFGGEAQFSAKHLANWLDCGIVDIRLEFVHESAAQLTNVVSEVNEFVAQTLAGKSLAHSQFERRLGKLAPAGITLGSLRT